MAHVTPPRPKQSGLWLAAPGILWLAIFFLLPLTFILAASFMTLGPAGKLSLPLTLEHYERIFTVFDSVFIRSIHISIYTTLICLLAGYPLAFFIKTRRRPVVRQMALFLVILPFWTNFLVRTYAWRVLLGREGTINSLLMNWGLTAEPLALLNNEFAVLVGLVYGYLPFMVLPIYASVERFDFHLVEAARDLGANNWHTFWRIALPLTLPGAIAGCILVFIPSIGTFITSDMLGGKSGVMIGNLVQNQFKATGNIALGSAMAMVMMAMVMVALLVYLRVSRVREQ